MGCCAAQPCLAIADLWGTAVMRNKHSPCAGEFVAHSGAVNCVRIGRSTAGVLATGGDDKKVNLWRTGQHEVVKVCHVSTTATAIKTFRFNPCRWNIALLCRPCCMQAPVFAWLCCACRAYVGCSRLWSVLRLMRRKTQLQLEVPMAPSRFGTWSQARVSAGASTPAAGPKSDDTQQLH